MAAMNWFQFPASDGGPAGLDALGHQLAADVLGGQVTAGALRPPPLGRLDLRPAASGAEGRPDPLGPDLRRGGLENRYARDSGPSCGTSRACTWTHRRWKRPAPTATPVHADRDRSKVSPAGGRAAKACLDILRGAQPPQGGPCWEPSMDGCSTAGSRPRWSARRGARSWPTAESGEAFVGKPWPRSAARGGRPGRLGLAL
jgi:hypothetical protein